MIDLNNWENFIPELSQKEVEIPHFDRASLRETGQRNPVWIHFWWRKSLSRISCRNRSLFSGSRRIAHWCHCL